MTGTSRSIFLNAASAASPSISPGITTSRITAAGGDGLEALHRFFGVVHRLRLRSRARPRKRRRKSHIAGSSSTTMTRMGSGMESRTCERMPARSLT